MTEASSSSFGKYEVVKRLDAGAMGEVYLAYQPLLERRVAIKILHPHLAHGDDFVDRFKREAAVIARLRHTNIMQVFDFDVSDDRYYMVLEFLEGPTLKAEMGERARTGKPFTLYEIAYIVNALASALDYAHVRGVIHRDIKPANIMFNDEGQIVLTDFGIVHIVGDVDQGSQAGQIVGTPAYMSPEQGAGKNIGAQSDIYSLGIVIYQLLAGQLPFQADSAMSMVLRHVNDAPPPLSQINRQIPPAVEAAVMKALEKEPKNRYNRAGAMATALRQAIGMSAEQALAAFSITAVPDTPPPFYTPSVVATDNDVTMISQSLPDSTQVVSGPGPYRGLFAFREHDARFFFGREAFTEQLVTLAKSQPFTVVAGPSGSGKSSVVFAGLVPAMRAEGDWLIADFRPAGTPFQSLSAALAPLLFPKLSEERLAQGIEQLSQQMKNGDVRFHSLLQRIRRNHPKKRLLLIIDQFEEIFTLVSDLGVRHPFLNEILEAIDIQKFLPEQTFSLVVTLRADFFAQALLYRPLADAIQDADVKLGPMSRDDLSRAIANPARRVGVEFEPGLVLRILNDVGEEPGNLPLLEFALSSLWDQRNGTRLTHEAYESVGGVEGALAGHANDVFDQLSLTEQHLARSVFIQLVQPGEGTEDTRRVAIRQELGQESWQLVQKLADARLVVTNVNASGQETVEVVHEALIRTWGRLREWMVQDRDFRAWQERLRQGLTQWQESNRDEGALLRGVLLQQAQEWAQNPEAALSTNEQTFIRRSLQVVERQQSEDEQARQRELEQAQQLNASRKRQITVVRWAAVLLSFLLIMAVGAAFFAFSQQREATANALQAEQQSTAAFESQETAVANEFIAATRAIQAEDAQGEAESARQESDELRITAEAARLTAEDERAAALQQSQIALAQSLASQALTLVEQAADTELSLLLALEAYRLNLDADGGIDWLIDSALRPLLSNRFFNTTLEGHEHNLRALTYSGDGTRLASASSDDTVRLWDLTQPESEPLVFRGHTEDVTGVVFNRAETLLISTSQDATIRLWNIDDPSSEPEVINGFSAIWSVALSPDGTLLATGHNDRRVRLWDLTDLTEPPIVLEGHEGSIWSLSFSMDRQYLASGSDDTTIRLWDMDNLSAPPRILSGHEERVTTSTFTPNAEQLITGSNDDTVRIWTIRDVNSPPTVLRRHQDDVNSVAVSPDGRLLASGSRDWEIFLYELSNPTSSVSQIDGHVDSIRALTFSPDAQSLASGDNASFIRIWHVGDPPGGPTILRGHEDRIWTVAYSPDGRFLATGSADLTLRIWNVREPSQPPIVLGGQLDGVRDVLFTHDSSLLLASSEDSQIRIWHTDDFERAPITLIGHEGSVSALALSPDGKMLASGSSDQTIQLWDIDGDNFIPRRSITGHTDVVLDLAFSPDGRYLISGSSDTTIRVHDLQNLDAEPTILDGHTDKVTTIDISPNSQLLASGSLDNTVRVWRLDDLSAAPIILSSHKENVLDVLFSPDGQTLASTSDDRTMMLWSPDDLARPPIVIVGHESSVRSIAFHPENSQFATVSNDQTVRIWLDLEALVDVACGQLSRNLTEAEWRQYFGPLEPYRETCS